MVRIETLCPKLTWKAKFLAPVNQEVGEAHITCEVPTAKFNLEIPFKSRRRAANATWAPMEYQSCDLNTNHFWQHFTFEKRLLIQRVRCEEVPSVCQVKVIAKAFRSTSLLGLKTQ